MTLSIYNTSPVALTGTFTSTAALDLLHGSSSLAANNNNIYDELRSLTSAEVTVADFTHNGTAHQIYAWDVLATGGLSAWTRASNGSSSGARTSMNADVLFIAVPSGVTVPTPTSPSGPPAPGTTQSTVKIKIGTQGSMPIG